MSDNQISLEERFKNLDGILARMEDGNTSLDETFELYKRGIEEMKAANEALDHVEKAMLVLNESNELEEF